jgi:spore coat polysaccharide biosynthesis predicted glycosyltransferase SpsG
MTGFDLVFYTQASAASGMGHLTRSAAVISSLDKYGIDSRVVLRVDDQGRALAQAKGLTERQKRTHGILLRLRSAY